MNNCFCRLIAFCILLISFEPLCGYESTYSSYPTTTSWSHVINYARDNLPQNGHLVQKSDGFVYLKVDDNYIYDLLPMLNLKHKGFRNPPYFRSPDSPGAHISVFYENEHIDPKELEQDLAKTYYFKLKDIKIVKPKHGASYVILQVYSPDLENLREKYGKSSLLFGHQFHITLGKKRN